MALLERQERILEYLKAHKNATVKALSEMLFVSEATLRRDLQELQSMGLIERNHGGARLHENADEISIFFRLQKNAKEKERVATKALPHIPPFRSVFIDASSTALALAERMDLSYKTVVTNNLQTAIQLSKKPNASVILLGGNLRYDSSAVSGSWTASLLNGFSFDLMICSCAGVENGEIYERTLDTKEIKRAAFLRSKKRILLFDHTKWTERGAFLCGKLAEFDLIVTDEEPKVSLPSDIAILY